MASRSSGIAGSSLSRGAWADRSRDRSLQLDVALLEEARRNSDAASQDTGFLFALADEIARTRAPELSRAHHALVAVMPGFKNTRARADRPAAAVARPCVVLVVRRKRDLADADPRRLPTWLVTFAEREGRRLPFALSTDVQDAAEHRGLRTHAASELWTQRAGFARNFGHFAALVQPDGDPSVYILSAMHVLSPDMNAEASVPLSLDLLPVDPAGQALAQPPMATGESFGGRLVPDFGNGAVVSLDLQLARIDAARLAQIVASCPLRGLDPSHSIAIDAVDLAAMAGQSNRFMLLRADNNPFGSADGAVLLFLSASAPDGDLTYDFAQGAEEVGLNVFQRGLLRFDAITLAVPRRGDSGSAIVFRNEANGLLTLVAMHIAGDGKGASLAIPAWTLFNTSEWDSAPVGALALIDAG